MERPGMGDDRARPESWIPSSGRRDPLFRHRRQWSNDALPAQRSHRNAELLGNRPHTIGALQHFPGQLFTIALLASWQTHLPK